MSSLLVYSNGIRLRFVALFMAERIVNAITPTDPDNIHRICKSMNYIDIHKIASNNVVLK